MAAELQIKTYRVNVMIAINDKKDCVGCHACLNLCPQSCISMESDTEGFWYPEVDYARCIKCGLCIKVCPIINKKTVHNNLKAYACINKNESVRMKSSSGGIFTLIAEHIINKDGVIFGAGFDENFSVSHSYIETKEELDRFRGSKYVQSKIGVTYKQVSDFLKLGKEVLFTGTPCQIGGLKSYLGQPYDNLFCIDIVCHGVPSPKVLLKYISYRENSAGSQVRRMSFRLKNKGWKRFSVSILFNNGTEYRQTMDKDLYMKAFLINICLRPSCYDCAFKTLHRESDITLADCWGIQDMLPDMDDDKGTSLIFVNSVNGQSMLKQIKDNILLKEVDVKQAVSYNSAAVKSVGYNPKRDAFFEGLGKLPFDQLVRKYCSDSMYARIKIKAKSIIHKVLKLGGRLVLKVQKKIGQNK